MGEIDIVGDTTDLSPDRLIIAPRPAVNHRQPVKFGFIMIFRKGNNIYMMTR